MKTMAKKTATKTAGKRTTPATGKTTTKVNPDKTIEAASVAALAKLKQLNLDEQLQSEIVWCLGSYRADGNASGLYEMVSRAMNVLRTEVARKTKGIPEKLITDLDKALQSKSGA